MIYGRVTVKKNLRKGTVMDKRCGKYALLAAVVFICSCVTNPVTGKKELSLVAPAQKKEIGEATDKQVIQQFGLYPDGGIQQYVANVEKRIVPMSHRPDLGVHIQGGGFRGGESLCRARGIRLFHQRDSGLLQQ